MIWRTGRHLGRTVYVQQTLEPSDDDQVIGMMDTRELAEQVVKAVNADSSLVGFGDAFHLELQNLINRYSIDSVLNTPDFILADYVTDTLWHLGLMLKARDDWGRVPTYEAKPDDS